MKFTIYYQSPKLYQQFNDLITTLPFDFSDDPRIGATDLSFGDTSDPMWAGFPMPIWTGDVYIFDDDIPATALGGAYSGRASIRVRDEDSDEVIYLRVWHELLHAVGKPADDMIRLSSEWLTGTDRIVWYLCRLFGVSVDVPYWQTKFYRWLSANGGWLV